MTTRVTTEDGCMVVFFKEDGNLKCNFFTDTGIYENEVRDGSIHAVVGEPLTFTYYYGDGSSAEKKTKTPVKKISYY